MERRLVKAAKEALDAVFSDTSVDRETTLEDLQGLSDELDMAIDALKEDLEGGEE